MTHSLQSRPRTAATDKVVSRPHELHQYKKTLAASVDRMLSLHVCCPAGCLDLWHFGNDASCIALQGLFTC